MPRSAATCAWPEQFVAFGLFACGWFSLMSREQFASDTWKLAEPKSFVWETRRMKPPRITT